MDGKLALQNGQNFTDDEILQVCEELGLDPTNLTENEILIVGNKINAMRAGAQNEAPIAKTKKGGNRKPATQRKERTQQITGNAKTPIQQIAEQSQNEINQLVAAMHEGSEHFSEEASEQMLEIIVDTPNRVLEKFGTKAAQFQGDPTFFRQRGEELAASIFGDY